jgi:hypothetical protein
MSHRLDQGADSRASVARQIIHDDVVAQSQLRHEDFLDIDLERIAVDRSV